MLNTDNKSKKNADKPEIRLATEGPFCEKDEQAKAIERMKQLQKEALEKWQRLQNKAIS